MSSTRDHILKAAVELFSEKGFDNTTIRDICQHADANVAGVNYHFKGKIGLGEAVIDNLFENVAEMRQSLLKAGQVSNSSEWEEAIRGFIYNFIVDRDKEEYRNYYRSRLIFLELNNPSELFGKMFQKYMGPIQKHLTQLIRQGLPEDTSDEAVGMWVVTLMSQCIMFRKKQAPSMEIANIDFSDSTNVKMVTDHIAGTLFSGLKFRG